MPNAVLPDVEAVAIAYLKSHAGLTAVIPAAQISSSVAGNVNDAGALTINRTGGTAPEPRWLDRAVLDVNAWATTKQQASLMIRTALAALHDMAQHHGSFGVVSGVDDILGPQWVPDDSRTPTLPRYLASVAVYAHPRK